MAIITAVHVSAITGARAGRDIHIQRVGLADEIEQTRAHGNHLAQQLLPLGAAPVLAHKLAQRVEVGRQLAQHILQLQE